MNLNVIVSPMCPRPLPMLELRVGNTPGSAQALSAPTSQQGATSVPLDEVLTDCEKAGGSIGSVVCRRQMGGSPRVKIPTMGREKTTYRFGYASGSTLPVGGGWTQTRMVTHVNLNYILLTLCQRVAAHGGLDASHFGLECRRVGMGRLCDRGELAE